MDVLLALLVIVGVISSMIQSAKKNGAGRTRTSAGRTSRPTAPQAPDETIRPMEVDLPGQTTMPTPRAHERMREMTVSPFEEAYNPSDAYEKESEIAALSAWLDAGYQEGPPATDRIARERREEQRRKAEAGAVTVPGLELTFNGDTLVKGVIFSEILSRRTPRRR